MKNRALKFHPLALAAAAALFALPAGAATDVTWTATPLTASSTSIRTDGTLKYAYARGNYTANGVAFAGSNGIINNENCVVWEATTGAGIGDTSPPSDTESGGYENLLRYSWWASAKGRKIQLNNLESGKRYLVQVIVYRRDYSAHSATAPDGVATIKFAGTGWEYGGSLTGTFTTGGTSEEFTIQYSGQACINAIQVRELSGSGEGSGPVDPGPAPTCSLTIPAKAGLVLQSVTTNGVAVTATSGSYSIVSNTLVTVTFVADTGYEIVGGNPVAFTITGAKTFVDADYPAVRTTGGGGEPVDPPAEQGWTSGPMSSTGDTIRTDGTLLYAYSSSGGTVGGVPFARAVNLGSASMVSASPASAGNSGGSFGDGGATGDFGNMLRDGWYWTGEEVPLSFTLTLSGLTAGQAYLVQLVSHRMSNSTTVSANGSTPVYIHGTHDGVDYTYGGSLVGVFTATGPTADIIVTYPTGTGNRPLNAIQVRELPSAAPAAKPSVLISIK